MKWMWVLPSLAVVCLALGLGGCAGEPDTTTVPGDQTEEPGHEGHEHAPGEGHDDETAAEEPGHEGHGHAPGEGHDDETAAEEPGHEGHGHAPGEGHDDDSAAVTELSAEDLAAIEKQKTCPVSGAALGSMGTSYKMTVKGRDMFLCCKSCEGKVLEDPDTYLAKLSAE